MKNRLPPNVSIQNMKTLTARTNTFATRHSVTNEEVGSLFLKTLEATALQTAQFIHTPHLCISEEKTPFFVLHWRAHFAALVGDSADFSYSHHYLKKTVPKSGLKCFTIDRASPLGTSPSNKENPMNSRPRVFAVITLMANNHLRFINQVSSCIADGNGNIEQQTSSVVGDQFTVTIMFSCHRDDMDKLQHLLMTELSQYHPRIVPCKNPDYAEALQADQIHCRLSLFTSTDSEAIVKQITRLLGGRDIDIQSLAAVVYPAPFDGSRIFMCEMSIMLPHMSVLKWLSTSMEAWESRFGWDLTLDVQDPDMPTTHTFCATAPYPPSRMMSTRF